MLNFTIKITRYERTKKKQRKERQRERERNDIRHGMYKHIYSNWTNTLINECNNGNSIKFKHFVFSFFIYWNRKISLIRFLRLNLFYSIKVWWTHQSRRSWTTQFVCARVRVCYSTISTYYFLYKHVNQIDRWRTCLARNVQIKMFNTFVFYCDFFSCCRYHPNLWNLLYVYIIHPHANHIEACHLIYFHNLYGYLDDIQ